MVMKRCAVPNCSGNYSKLYKFPKDRIFEKRLCKWLSVVGDKELLHLSEKLLLERAICNIHFESKYFFGRGLSRSAVPSLYLPDRIEVPVDHFSYVETEGAKVDGSNGSRAIDEPSTSESNPITEPSTSESNPITEGFQMHRYLKRSREENKETAVSTKIRRKEHSYCCISMRQ